MSSHDSIIKIIQEVGPICDDCISDKTGIQPRQQVNQICRRLFKENTILRSNENCSICGKYKITNKLITNVILEVSPSTQKQKTGDQIWYSEQQVQLAIAEYLKRNGCQIVRTANTASKEPGIDIVARTSINKVLWIEVKGYPENGSPTQARHYFGDVLFKLILCREQNPTAELGIGLPRFGKTYDSLSKRVSWFKKVVPFKFYWVGEKGDITEE